MNSEIKTQAIRQQAPMAAQAVTDFCSLQLAEISDALFAAAAAKGAERTGRLMGLAGRIRQIADQIDTAEQISRLSH